MISAGINLVMTVIGFTVSTLFIVFVCTRLICARIHLNATRRSFARSPGSDLNILERGIHGLEPVVVANFPTKKFRELCLSSKENAQCTVCLSEYHEEDTLRILPPCGHSFHATCIDIWLQQHSTCPVCRISLRELSERKWFMQPMFSSAVRSQYTIQSANARYCHCMANTHRHPSGSHNNCNLGPGSTHAGPCRPEGDTVNVTVGDGNSASIEHNRIFKDSANRKVESQSGR